MLIKVTGSKCKPLVFNKIWYWGRVEFATTQFYQNPSSVGLIKALSKPIEITFKENQKHFCDLQTVTLFQKLTLRKTRDTWAKALKKKLSQVVLLGYIGALEKV